MALLTCEHVCLGYDGREIVHNLYFTVHNGDYLCIVGENGSGKTTLMKALLGLHRPLHGEIVTGEGLRQQEIGYLPQQTDVQRDFPATVREIVLSGCQGRHGFHPFYSKSDKRLAHDTMQKLGICQLAGHCYRELSGGQQQRVLLARALCATQKLLLLDEPVAGLDPKAAAEMYRLVQQLNQNGLTVIMISHDLNAALGHASHVLHVGETNFFGTTADYQAHFQTKGAATV